MHAQVLHVRFGDHAADGIRDSADAELQSAAACHIREDIGGDLPVRLRRRRALHRRDRQLRLHNVVHIPNVDMVVGQSRYCRHGGVHLEDDMLRRIQDLLHGAVGEAVGEVPVFVHGRDRDHRHIHRRITLAVIGPVVPEQHRRMERSPLVDILPVQSGAVPKVIGKGTKGVILHGRDRNHGDRVADLHIVQLSAAFCQCCIQCLREGTGLAVVYPVPVLYELYRFLRRAELLCIDCLIIHIRPSCRFLF